MCRDFVDLPKLECCLSFYFMCVKPLKIKTGGRLNKNTGDDESGVPDVTRPSQQFPVNVLVTLITDA